MQHRLYIFLVNDRYMNVYNRRVGTPPSLFLTFLISWHEQIIKAKWCGLSETKSQQEENLTKHAMSTYA